MQLVPFDTSKSKWLESGEIVRIKDATDSNYDREGEIIDRTIYGGTVHFENCDVKYRNDQLERLGQRKVTIWRIVDGALSCNGRAITYNIGDALAWRIMHALIKAGDLVETS